MTWRNLRSRSYTTPDGAVQVDHWTHAPAWNMAVGGKPHILRRDGKWRCCFIAYPEKWGPPDFRQACLVTGTFEEAAWQAAFLGAGFPESASQMVLRRRFGKTNETWRA